MRFLNLIISSSVISYPSLVFKSRVQSMDNLVTCSEKKECPSGSFCLRMYGDSGFCVLTGSHLNKFMTDSSCLL